MFHACTLGSSLCTAVPKLGANPFPGLLSAPDPCSSSYSCPVFSTYLTICAAAPEWADPIWQSSVAPSWDWARGAVVRSGRARSEWFPRTRYQLCSHTERPSWFHTSPPPGPSWPQKKEIRTECWFTHITTALGSCWLFCMRQHRTHLWSGCQKNSNGFLPGFMWLYHETFQRAEIKLQSSKPVWIDSGVLTEHWLWRDQVVFSSC